MIEPVQFIQIEQKLNRSLQKFNFKNSIQIACSICYNVELSSQLNELELKQFEKLIIRRINKLSHNKFDIGLKLNMCCGDKTFTKELKPVSVDNYDICVEIGPRLNFCTPLSTNAVCICSEVELDKILRIEISHVYLISSSINNFIKENKSVILNYLYDRMTEEIYKCSIKSFNHRKNPENNFYIDILSNGKGELEKINKSMGLAMDEWDLNYYYEIFHDKIKRNPTNVECFDLAQSNSEHSRHWFFKGKMVIDGDTMPESLFQMIMNTQTFSNKNNVIAFSDNSSAIKGNEVSVLILNNPAKPSKYVKENRFQDICFTAETHNFPTGVAPFPGAATGTGGRIRDVQAIGRGGCVVAGTAGYCFGSSLPWLKESKRSDWICSNMATSLEIAIEASNGASDYGNKFGEPVIGGFCRSFGMKIDNEWREWLKPIMFSGGIGQVYKKHETKCAPRCDDLVVKIGGPVYRIGVGGGAASSVEIQGDQESRDAQLDHGAVQRGDAQMENKMNRVVRASIDLGLKNPIRSIHDQGAGGNGNVLKEIVEPLGAIIDPDQFILGDPTISILELWGAEYQESNGLLISEVDIDYFREICNRERCPICVVGRVTNDGRIKLKNWTSNEHKDDMEYPVDLDLDVVLGKMPQKIYEMKRKSTIYEPLKLPDNLKFQEAVISTFIQPVVGSKRFLTNKVDRSVTGLVAQQQCVGPYHTPLADVAVVALSYWDTVGAATSIGEQPIKLLLDSARGARMTVGEALSNLIIAPISDIGDIKMSGNWMWPAKLSGEGAKLWDTCSALCDVLSKLGVAIDGGKDSLSMAAKVVNNKTNETDVVKAPGSLVLSCYVACTDITKLITPDFKGNGHVFWIRPNLLKSTEWRLGGSALCQAYNQLGDECPDLDDVKLFQSLCQMIQCLINKQLIVSIHDISDGGFITSLLEMAFAGNVSCDINVQLENNKDIEPLPLLFSEEIGWIIEVSGSSLDQVKEILFDPNSNNQYSALYIGETKTQSFNDYIPIFNLTLNNSNLFQNINLASLRGVWEESSYQFEKHQCDLICVEQEYGQLKDESRKSIDSHHYYWCSIDYNNSGFDVSVVRDQARVMILREEGSNGDKEMAAAFYQAGFECWDVMMQDLLNGTIDLDRFNGIAFVGGFSYGDVFGAGRGWAASIVFNKRIKSQFDHFYNRTDTFSLGVCNGCQLLVQLGWIQSTETDGKIIPELQSELPPSVRLEGNESGRFESRFNLVQIPENTNSIMLRKLRGSKLGIWVAHGEGRFQFDSQNYLKQLNSNGQIAMRYTEPGVSSEDDISKMISYPSNPNGSSYNTAGLVSLNGRHLAVMPHPERTVQWWQWPYKADIYNQWDSSHVSTLSPWFSMFHEAYQWSLSHK